MIIKVENFPKKASKKQLKGLFKTYGKVSSIVKRSSRAFIRIKDEAKAEKAIKALDGKEWGDRSLEITEEESSPTTSICRTQHGVFNLI